MQSYNIDIIKKNLIEMLYDRGFDSPKEYEEFKNQKINLHDKKKDKRSPYLSVKKSIQIENEADYDEILNVYFIGYEKYTKDITDVIKSQAINEYESLKNKNTRVVQLIIFFNKLVSAHIKHKNEENAQNIKKFGSKNIGYKIEFMEANFLVINRGRNVIIPKHILLTQKEIKEEIEPYFKHLKMPEIKLNDPQILYLGAEIKDIIKITRNTKTNMNFTTYRKVVA